MNGSRGKRVPRGRIGLAVGAAVVALLGTACSAESASSGPRDGASAVAGDAGPKSDAAAQDDAKGAEVRTRDAGSGTSAKQAVSGDFTILQMNLCNSGKAGCYEDGKSIDEGIGRIRTVDPTVVTVNEVCRGDVARMAKETGRRGIFQAAGDSDGGLYKCADGQDYGIGIIGGRPYEPAPETRRGWYPQQDGSREQRAYLCAEFTGHTACTTHLALDSEVALQQCKGNAWPLKGREDEHIVLGGDLNLKYDGSPDAQECVPAGFFRKGYTTTGGLVRGVQHVMAADAAYSFSRQETLPMNYTDHPAFAVHLKTK